MNTHPQNGNGTNDNITNKIAAGMLSAVKRNYVQLFEAAKNEWERKYAGPDPSDTCVSVRISPAEPRLSRGLSNKHVSLAVGTSFASATF